MTKTKEPRLWRNNRRLREALEYALECQAAVEDARADGYGSPDNTLAWMEEARHVLRVT